MLVYPVLVLAFGALWPLDWTHTRLDSLSSVTGHYKGNTWAMAEKVTGDGDPEEVVVLEGTTTDEVGKDNKESPKGWKESCENLAKDWEILDKNGNIKWDKQSLLLALAVMVMALTGYIPIAVAVIIMVVCFVGKKCYNFIKDKCFSQCSGNSLKGMSAKNVD